MYKYIATNANVTKIVIALQSNLMDFVDYGFAVTEPNHRQKVYGWIKTEEQVNDSVCKMYGLFPD